MMYFAIGLVLACACLSYDLNRARYNNVSYLVIWVSFLVVIVFWPFACMAFVYQFVAWLKRKPKGKRGDLILDGKLVRDVNTMRGGLHDSKDK